MSTPGLLCRADFDQQKRAFYFNGYYTNPVDHSRGWIDTTTWWNNHDFIMATGKEIHFQGQDWHQWLHVRHNVLIWFLPVHLKAFYQV